MTNRFLQYQYISSILSREKNICTDQLPSNNVPLKMDGILSNIVDNSVNLQDKGGARSLYIHSGAGSVGDYIIIGKQNNVEITETITAIAGTRVETTNLYDEIFSITPQFSSIVKVFVGTAQKGFFPLINIDPNAYNAYNISLTTLNNDNSVKATVFKCLDNITESKKTFLELKNNLSNNIRNTDLKQIHHSDDQHSWFSNNIEIGFVRSLLIYFEMPRGSDNIIRLNYFANNR